MVILTTFSFAYAEGVSENGSDTVQGRFSYRLRGPGASLDGLAYWILMSCEIPVFMVGIQRTVEKLLKNPYIAKRMGKSSEELSHYIRGELPIDCSALPFSTRYTADLQFELKRDEKGIYRLYQGSLVYMSDNTTSIAYDGGSIRDKFHGSGTYRLDPELDDISLSFDFRTDPPTYLFEVGVNPFERVNGRSVWAFWDVGEIVVRRTGPRGVISSRVMGKPAMPPIQYLDADPRRYVGYVRFDTLDRLSSLYSGRRPVLLAALNPPRLVAAGSADACDQFELENTETYRSASGAQTVANYRLQVPFQCIAAVRWKDEQIEAGVAEYRKRLRDVLMARDSIQKLQKQIQDCDRTGSDSDACEFARDSMNTMEEGLDAMADDCRRISKWVNKIEPSGWRSWFSDEVAQKKNCDNFLECVKNTSGKGAAKDICRTLVAGPADFCQITHELVNSTFSQGSASIVQAYETMVKQLPCLAKLYAHPLPIFNEDFNNLITGMANARQPLAGLH